MKHLLQQCLEALEIGRDSAYAEAQDYHQKYEGYRPLRHKALDDDVAKIESAITALKEALAKDEQISNFVKSQESLGEDFSKALHDNLWNMYVSDESKPKDEQAPCWCHKCNQNVFVHGIPFSCTQMIVCPDCGNKRCPKASDHTLQCIGSNEPGQSSVAVVDEVAIALRDEYPNIFNGHFTSEPMPEGTRLYTRPAQRQPLSDEEIHSISETTYDLLEEKYDGQPMKELNAGLAFNSAFARAIENAVYEKMGIK